MVDPFEGFTRTGRRKTQPEVQRIPVEKPFQSMGLARRAEGQQYLANPNGKQAMARRKRQLERQAAKSQAKGELGREV